MDNWVPGGALRVYSKRRNVWHFGIAGTITTAGPMVMHASKERGQFVRTTFYEFAEGQPAEYTWLPGTVAERRRVLTRARAQIGKPYRLIGANCEDYVNWIVTGIAKSPQRERFVLGWGLIALIAACLAG